MKQQRALSFGYSVQLLIVANVIAIVLAYWQQWDLNVVLWVYWFQSVIIGLFQAKKIANLKQFSTKNFKISGQSVEPTEKTKRWTLYFFLFHFNFFHFIYLIFLAQRPGVVAWTAVLVGAGVFFLNHLLSYRKNNEVDKMRVPNIGKMMFFPYARIMPMHLAVILGTVFFAGPTALIFFLMLKTAADVIMHVWEHRYMI